MRYFTNELWNRINSDSEDEREKAYLEWEKNDKEYYEMFKIVKGLLPKNFIKIYEQAYKNEGYNLSESNIEF